MSKNSTSGTDQEVEPVVPVKILVRPGFSGAETGTGASSLRRRSIPEHEEGPSGSRQLEDGGESGNIFLISGSGSNQVEELSVKASLEIEDDGVVKNVAFYMDHCFRLMYRTGMSTYNPDKKETDESTLRDNILGGIQKVAYWTVTLVSLAFAVMHLKHNWIMFSIERGVPEFLHVGSWAFTIVSEIYYMLLFAFRHKRINETLMAIRKLGACSAGDRGTKKWKCCNPLKLITILFIASLFACFMQPMGGFGNEKWSPMQLILDSSTKQAFMLFVWKPEDASNSTKIHKIVQKYGKKLTPGTFIMGITDIAMRYCSNLKMDVALNMGIVVAILTSARNRHLAKKMQNVDFKQLHNPSDAEELTSNTGLFSEYKQVKEENKMLNGLLNGLLKIIHGYSVMQGATFFIHCVDNEATITEFTFLVYNFVKVVIMYYYGKKAESQNEVYEQWIIDWGIHSTDMVFLTKAPFVFHEITRRPMGVGRGKLLVGQGFIFKCLGFVGSIFMLEVDGYNDAD